MGCTHSSSQLITWFQRLWSAKPNHPLVVGRAWRHMHWDCLRERDLDGTSSAEINRCYSCTCNHYAVTTQNHQYQIRDCRNTSIYNLFQSCTNFKTGIQRNDIKSRFSNICSKLRIPAFLLLILFQRLYNSKTHKRSVQ